GFRSDFGVMVTVGPSDVTSTGISFPVVSFREIFSELESMSWSKVAVSLSALVGIFIAPFAGDVPIVCGGSSNGRGDVAGVGKTVSFTLLTVTLTSEGIDTKPLASVTVSLKV